MKEKIQFFHTTFFVVTFFYTFAVPLSYGVMVAQQILVLFVQVRVLVRQQFKNQTVGEKPTVFFYFICSRNEK